MRDFSIGRVSININGDLSEKEIAEKGKIAEKSGLKVIWVGDFDFDPFLTAEILAKHTKLLIGFGVLSVEKRVCEKILTEIESLERKFGNRFLVGVGAGEFKDAKKAVEKVLRCIEILKPRKVFAGCSSPRIAKLSSLIADGVLINYVNPPFVKWLASYIENGLKIAYGPALLFSSQLEEDLVLAAAVVLKGVEKRFGINLEVNLKELISKRRRGESIRDSGIFEYKEFLLNNFALYGSLEEIKVKIKALLQICDHVVLSDPFFRDEQSLKNLEAIVKTCATF